MPLTLTGHTVLQAEGGIAVDWLLDVVLALFHPMSWFRDAKRGAPRRILHLDPEGRVVSAHRRGEPCESCTARGAVG